ncbi:macro domain-containing protein [Chlamydia buteonis]|uniref:Macro domain-containing protein n=1 Tax=Chlamydia buteonis TaxID=2494525 RepID=A0ABX8LC89_9CHLA|nr:macro domain-containing protein [Chlamydia buteonis]QXE27165.1 macro domain-containing protein [Chlamydia buteonis]QXE27913.1 macro domain-containing protein [Chlamydia buteonis]
MSQPINSYESSQFVSRASTAPCNRNCIPVKKAALATIAGLAFVGAVTTLALAIVFSMPTLSAAVVIFSIMAVACCILLKRRSEISTPDLSPPLSFQPEDLSTPEHSPPPSPIFHDLQDVPGSPTPRPRVLPTAAAVPLQTVPNPRELLESLTKLQFRQAINTPQFDPIDSNTTFSGWQVPNTETVLVSTCGDITKPRFLTRDLTPMLVNAANDTMYRFGGGTNHAFTQAVSYQGWQNSTEGKTCLNIGECTAGKWININGTTNDGDSSAPALLAQLLGPTANQLNNDALRCYETVTTAYENCLAKAVEKGAKYVQLPLISSSIFAPSANLSGGTVRAKWIEAIKAALVTAVTNFARQNPNSQMIVVVTDIANPPLG